MKVYRVSFRDRSRKEIESVELQAITADMALTFSQKVARRIKGCVSMSAVLIGTEDGIYVN
ncbi:hypothetical protein [Anaerosinus sp.]